MLLRLPWQAYQDVWFGNPVLDPMLFTSCYAVKLSGYVQVTPPIIQVRCRRPAQFSHSPAWPLVLYLERTSFCREATNGRHGNATVPV